MKTTKKTAETVLKSILAHFDRTSGTVERTALGKLQLSIETDHGKADRIGQYALRGFKSVHTYFACHVFRKARLSIYFK